MSYRVARTKKKEPFSKEVELGSEMIEFSAFKSGLSVLESTCTYLASYGKSFSQIARLLNKDQRTIWTVCKRAERKLAKGVEKKK